MMTIQMLLSQLRQSGMTDADIGAEIGAPQSIVTRLRTGTHRSTSYERGLAIEALVSARIPPDPAKPKDAA